MSRHVADKPRTTGTGARLAAFARIEREEGAARPQTLDLQRRARGARDEARRMQEFVRIERGQSA